MSTRSVTHFTYGETVIARVYRHSDGYPSGAGTDILRFFRDVAAQTNDTRFNDPSYLAAKYVVWLAAQFATTWDKRKLAPLNFLSVGVVTTDPGDIEYRYVVDCKQPGTVRCESVSGAAQEIPPIPDGEEAWSG